MFPWAHIFGPWLLSLGEVPKLWGCGALLEKVHHCDWLWKFIVPPHFQFSASCLQLRCHRSASCSCCLLPCQPAMKESYPSRTISPGEHLGLSVAVGHVILSQQWKNNWCHSIALTTLHTSSYWLERLMCNKHKTRVMIPRLGLI